MAISARISGLVFSAAEEVDDDIQEFVTHQRYSGGNMFLPLVVAQPTNADDAVGLGRLGIVAEIVQVDAAGYDPYLVRDIRRFGHDLGAAIVGDRHHQKSRARAFRASDSVLRFTSSSGPWTVIVKGGPPIRRASSATAAALLAKWTCTCSAPSRAARRRNASAST